MDKEEGILCIVIMAMLFGDIDFEKKIRCILDKEKENIDESND